MADSKVTALTALTDPIYTDQLYIVDDPGGTAVGKKITIFDLGKGCLVGAGIESNNAMWGGAGNLTMTGLESTGFGKGACDSLESAGATTAFGYLALTACTTGEYNTGIGTHALTRTTTGRYNTALGVDTLYWNVSGNENVAIGKFSMFNALGSFNTGCGCNSLVAMTTGTRNTGVGSNVLNSLTTGTDNTVVGSAAATSLSTSSYNTSIGQSSLSLATGAGNTAVGYLAGGHCTTGSNNVFIGTSNFVAASYQQVTTGSRNVSIGVETAVPSQTASNQLCISNYIYGTGMNGSGSTISSGKIGIGKKAPDYNLDVAGTFGIAPGASVTPANNGDVVFELTSNTSLTIKAKGSDGTVRSVVLTLA
jgi:hypothetical protein